MRNVNQIAKDFFDQKEKRGIGAVTLTMDEWGMLFNHIKIMSDNLNITPEEFKSLVVQVIDMKTGWESLGKQAEELRRTLDKK